MAMYLNHRYNSTPYVGYGDYSRHAAYADSYHLPNSSNALDDSYGYNSSCMYSSPYREQQRAYFESRGGTWDSGYQFSRLSHQEYQRTYSHANASNYGRSHFVQEGEIHLNDITGRDCNEGNEETYLPPCVLQGNGKGACENDDDEIEFTVQRSSCAYVKSHMRDNENVNMLKHGELIWSL